jgi:acyl-coenzyme A thioesterase PaaI-like protein
MASDSNLTDRGNGADSARKSLQEIYAPRSVCFGCGPANERGLQLKIHSEGDQLVALWKAQPHHLAFPGVLNGGIVSTLLDCLCNWTAAYSLLQRDGLDRLPSTVTAELTVRMLKPTPLHAALRIEGRLKRLGQRSAVTTGVIWVDGDQTANCEATFVAVQAGHPAYHRW